MEDGVTLCGIGAFKATSFSTKLSVALLLKSRYQSSIHCVVRAVPDPCQCGQKNRGRIVGGVTTGINEFPMMAGLTDVNDGKIFCGATISEY